jgi:predicted transcriptional regulator
VSFRLRADDKAKLRELAEREHRSVSQQIRHLIHQAHAAGQEVA